MAAQAPDSFHDIVDGDNVCSRNYCGPECVGFKAAQGWDPVTGLGTPNAAKMEAFVSALLDEVLAKRARAAAITHKADIATSTSTAPAKLHSCWNHQQPTAPTIDSLLACNSRWRGSRARQQRPSLLSAFGVEPDDVWQGLNPLAIGAIDQRMVAVALLTSHLLLDTRSLSVMSTCPIDPSLQLAGFAASNPSLVLLLIDRPQGIAYLNGVDPRTCTTTTTTTLPYNTTLLAVNSKGRTALTSDGSTRAVLVDTSSGRQVAVYANSTWSGVVGGAINPASGDVWVAWVVQTHAAVRAGIDVYSGTSVHFAWQLPSSMPVGTVLSVAIDAAGQYAYVLYATQASGVRWFIQQVDASNGSSVSTWTLHAELPPTTDITASSRWGEVLYMSNSQLVVVSSGSMTSSQVGNPPIPFPSDVAVTSDGHVLVAEDRDSQIEVLNVWGQVMSRYPPVVVDCDVSAPLLTVAVDSDDNVYMPLCNSTVLIFDSDANVVAQVPTGSHSIPRSVSPGPGQTVFFTDDSNPHQVTQVDRDGNVVDTFTTANTDWLFTVKYDRRSQSVWATDMLNGQILVWAVNGTKEPTKWDINALTGQTAAVYSLAIDHGHQQVVASVIFETEFALLWFDMNGALLSKNYTTTAGMVLGVAVSSEGSRVYGADFYNDAVLVFYQDEVSISSVEHMERPSKATSVVSE